MTEQDNAIDFIQTSNKARKYENKKKEKKTITSWAINVKWSDGTVENITDIPDDVSSSIDDYLTEIEEN